MGFIVVGNPQAHTIISSLSAHPKYFFKAAIITRFADDPLLTITECLKSNLFENSFSNLFTFSPAGNHLPVRRDDIAAVGS